MASLARVFRVAILLAAFTALSHGQGNGPGNSNAKNGDNGVLKRMNANSNGNSNTNSGNNGNSNGDPQNRDPVDVFGEIQEVAGDVGPQESGKSATAHLKRIVKANGAPIRDGSARLRLSLTSTQTVTASKTLQEKVGDFEVWLGAAEGGDAEERVSMVAGPNGTVYGTAVVKNPDGGFRILEILPMKSDPTQSTVSELSVAQFPDGDPLKTPYIPDSRASRRRRQSAGDSGGTVDVLVVHTPAVTSYYGLAGIQAKIVSTVADTNTALYNSQVPARFNLVHMAEINFTETGDMLATLGQLQSKTDGIMDSIHALRDKYKADLVQLATTDTQYCGIGYMMGAGSVGRPVGADAWGFSVVAHLCMSQLTPTHEWGHNLGLQHNKENGGDSVLPYAYGYRICGTGGMQTVMSYYCTGTVRVPYFSNPKVTTSRGQITGVANQTENARAIAQTVWTVANYRVAGVVRIPPIPTYLDATAPFGKRVDLKWHDVPDETGFRVYRKAQSEATFTLVGSVATNTLAYTDTTVAPATTYTYRVAAFNSAGQSEQSIPVDIPTPVNAEPLVDEIPEIAISRNADGSAVVVYIAPLKNPVPTTFTIERSINVAPPVTIGITSTTGNFIDSTITPGGVYAYDVIAVGPSGKPRKSVVKTLAIPLKPPGGLIAAVQGTTITTTWTAVAGATHYLVTRRATSGPGFTLNPNSTQFTIATPTTKHVSSGLSFATAYQFTVQAISTVSPLVSSANAATTARIGVGPPSQISCSAASAAAVRVSWGGSIGAVGYTVQLLTATGPLLGPRTDHPGSSTGMVWAPLEPSSTYRFVVYARSSTAASPPSAMCTVTTARLLGSVLANTVRANNQIGLRWNAVIGASGYTLRRSTPLVAGSTPTAINISALAVTYTDRRAIAPNRRYDYTITPYYSRGVGPVSTVLSVTTPPIQPAVSLVLSSQSKGTTTAMISWTLRTGVSTNNLRFKVYRRASNQSASTLIATLGGTTRSYTQMNLQRGLAYTYYVYYDNVYGLSFGAYVITVVT